LAEPHAAKDTEALLAAWRLLQSVRSVTLTVWDGAADAFQAQGTGSVAIEVVGASQMVMRERGRWTDPRGSGTHYTDALRWTLDHDAGMLRLQHLRRGTEAPVTVLELIADGVGGLIPLGPHLCGKDRYEGSLRLLDGEAEVSWRVAGPGKNLEIRRRYR
jgi:hypothetical protein